MKKGEEGLKNASFWVINFKNFRGEGLLTPPPPAANLFIENYMKNGGKGLKNASFWVLNSKKFRGLPTLPCTSPAGRGFAPPAAILFVE